MIRFLYVIGFITFLFCTAYVCSAEDMLYLKSGSRYIGEITDVTTNDITIKTDSGVRTYPWKVVHLRSIKQFNPALFEELRQEALAEREKQIEEKGYVKYKGKWMLPEQKEKLEKKEQGLEYFEGEWKPTNEVAKIRYVRKMKAEGKVEYDGKWFTEDELEKYKEREEYKGLELGMTTEEVKKFRGEPTLKKQLGTYTSKPEMWFYEDEENQTEDRVLFEHGKAKKIEVDQPISNKL